MYFSLYWLESKPPFHVWEFNVHLGEVLHFELFDHSFWSQHSSIDLI